MKPRIRHHTVKKRHAEDRHHLLDQQRAICCNHGYPTATTTTVIGQGSTRVSHIVVVVCLLLLLTSTLPAISNAQQYKLSCYCNFDSRYGLCKEDTGRCDVKLSASEILMGMYPACAGIKHETKGYYYLCHARSRKTLRECSVFEFQDNTSGPLCFCSSHDRESPCNNPDKLKDVLLSKVDDSSEHDLPQSTSPSTTMTLTSTSTATSSSTFTTSSSTTTTTTPIQPLFTTQATTPYNRLRTHPPFPTRSPPLRPHPRPHPNSNNNNPGFDVRQRPPLRPLENPRGSDSNNNNNHNNINVGQEQQNRLPNRGQMIPRPRPPPLYRPPSPVLRRPNPPPQIQIQTDSDDETPRTADNPGSFGRWSNAEEEESDDPADISNYQPEVEQIPIFPNPIDPTYPTNFDDDELIDPYNQNPQSPQTQPVNSVREPPQTYGRGGRGGSVHRRPESPSRNYPSERNRQNPGPSRTGAGGSERRRENPHLFSSRDDNDDAGVAVQRNRNPSIRNPGSWQDPNRNQNGHPPPIRRFPDDTLNLPRAYSRRNATVHPHNIQQQQWSSWTSISDTRQQQQHQRNVGFNVQVVDRRPESGVRGREIQRRPTMKPPIQRQNIPHQRRSRHRGSDRDPRVSWRVGDPRNHGTNPEQQMVTLSSTTTTVTAITTPQSVTSPPAYRRRPSTPTPYHRHPSYSQRRVDGHRQSPESGSAGRSRSRYEDDRYQQRTTRRPVVHNQFSQRRRPPNRLPTDRSRISQPSLPQSLPVPPRRSGPSTFSSGSQNSVTDSRQRQRSPQSPGAQSWQNGQQQAEDPFQPPVYTFSITATPLSGLLPTSTPSNPLMPKPDGGRRSLLFTTSRPRGRQVVSKAEPQQHNGREFGQDKKLSSQDAAENQLLRSGGSNSISQYSSKSSSGNNQNGSIFPNRNTKNNDDTKVVGPKNPIVDRRRILNNNEGTVHRLGGTVSPSLGHQWSPNGAMTKEQYQQRQRQRAAELRRRRLLEEERRKQAAIEQRQLQQLRTTTMPLWSKWSSSTTTTTTLSSSHPSTTSSSLSPYPSRGYSPPPKNSDGIRSTTTATTTTTTTTTTTRSRSLLFTTTNDDDTTTRISQTINNSLEFNPQKPGDHRGGESGDGEISEEWIDSDDEDLDELVETSSKPFDSWYYQTTTIPTSSRPGESSPSPPPSQPTSWGSSGPAFHSPHHHRNISSTDQSKHSTSVRESGRGGDESKHVVSAASQLSNLIHGPRLQTGSFSIFLYLFTVFYYSLVG